MLDRTFQDFCLHMLDFELDAAPTRSAKERGLHRLMERNVIEAMRTWMVNRIVPSFSASINLQGNPASDVVVDLARSALGSSGGGSHGRSGGVLAKLTGKDNDATKMEVESYHQTSTSTSGSKKNAWDPSRWGP